jgi:hypothetical protein
MSKNQVLGNCDCPLCGFKLQEVRIAQGGKPYIICDECGMQLFARQARSVRILKEKTAPIYPESKPAESVKKKITKGAEAVTPDGARSEIAAPVPASAPEKEKTIFDFFGA